MLKIGEFSRYARLSDRIAHPRVPARSLGGLTA